VTLGLTQSGSSANLKKRPLAKIDSSKDHRKKFHALKEELIQWTSWGCSIEAKMLMMKLHEN